MDTEITLDLARQLRRARDAAELTQADAAALAGVTKARWSQMESGSVANINKLYAACNAIGAVLNASVEIPSED